MALSRDDWTHAALFAIAEGGTGAVAIEPLAARLGATKGSFYWHFRNRDELVREALAGWEREATDEIIAGLREVEDPVERLRSVLVAAMEDENDEYGAIDAALLASAGDPSVAPVVERVQQKRMVFLERCFRDMGLPRALQRSGGAAGQARDNPGREGEVGQRRRGQHADHRRVVERQPHYPPAIVGCGSQCGGPDHPHVLATVLPSGPYRATIQDGRSRV